jgi:hypothetical protein
LLALALLAVAGAVPLRAQAQDWQYKWYWGAKVGASSFWMPGSRVFDPEVGGEWLITARRAALYIGYSTTLTARSGYFSTFTAASAAIPVYFSGLSRIQVAALVFPLDGRIQPYIGGGFVLEELRNKQLYGAVSHNDSVIVARDLPGLSSGAFTLLIGGVQYRLGKTAIFGQAQFSPQGRSFLIDGSAVSLEFGVRYALTGSREDDVTSHR